MCYQKYHDCKYCKNPYPCNVDDYVCPTINHDVNMYMCPDCEYRLEVKLEEVDIDEIDLFDINLKNILGDE